MDLLLIGGVSGSGKSVALAAFEDAGYYTVNNLPVPLLVETADYLTHSGQQRVAIALDVKSGPGLPRLADAMALLAARKRVSAPRFRKTLDQRLDGGVEIDEPDLPAARGEH
jgi:UPF0042 nucleotide-binding protein